MINRNDKNSPCLAHSDRINLISFAPDGKYIVSGSEDTTVKVWDAESGRLRHTFYALEGGYPLSMAISPDGALVATGYGFGIAYSVFGKWDPRAIIVRELQSGKTIKILKGHQYGINSLSFSPDGRWLLSASHYYDKNPVLLWDIKKGRRIRTYKGFSFHGRFISFLPDGKSFVAAGEHNDIALVDVDSGEIIRLWQDDGKHFLFPDWGILGPDGKKLLLGADRNDEYTIRDIENGQEGWTKTQQSYLSLALSPDGHTVACGREGGIDFYHLDTGEKIKTFTLPQTNVAALAFSPDGKRIALGSDNNADALYSVHFKILDAETGAVRHSLFTPADYSAFAACAPDGKHIYTRGSRNSMKVWDTATGEEVTRITGDWRDIRYAGLSSDGKCLAGALADSDLIKIWDVASGSEALTISTGLSDEIVSFHFRCGGNRIVVLTKDGLHIFNAKTGLCISSIPGNFFPFQPNFNSSDDRYLAVWGHPEDSKLWKREIISVFDIATAAEIAAHPLPEHKGSMGALYYASGITLAAYYDWDPSRPKGQENTITVYDADSGEIRYTDSVSDFDEDTLSFSSSGESFIMGCGKRLLMVSLKERGSAKITDLPVNHKGFIAYAACLPDIVISASYDVINIVDTKTQRLLRTIETSTDLCLLPTGADGRFLATASNCLVQFWDIEKKTQEAVLPVFKYPEFAVCAPDGKELFFVDDYPDSAFYRYDTVSGKTRHAFHVSKELRDIGGFCFRPGTEELLLHGRGHTKTAKVFNFNTGSEILTISRKNRIPCAAYSHRGDRIACGDRSFHLAQSKQNMVIFDANTGAEIRKFPRSRDVICTVAFSHDDRYLVTGSDHHKVVLWDAEQTARIRTYTGHKDGINVVAFTHDDRRIVSSSEDTTMRIWDSESAACLAVFPGIRELIPESVSSPAWRYIAALTVHGTVKLFSKDTLEEAMHLVNFKDGTWVFD